MGAPVAGLPLAEWWVHEQGNTEHGQAPEEHTHPLPTLWSALVSQAETQVRLLRIRRHGPPARIPLGQAQPSTTSVRQAESIGWPNVQIPTAERAEQGCRCAASSASWGLRKRRSRR